MCGRFFVAEKDIDDFADLVSKVEKELLKKAGEICPGDYAPVITPVHGIDSEKARRDSIIGYHAIKWGFPVKRGRPVINARCETVHEKPLFKLPFATRRCLIPARGFFEWKDSETGKKRIKHYISLYDGRIMNLAGLYWFFKGKEGILKPFFAIITTCANSDIKSIHDRMPVIVSEDMKSIWLYESDLTLVSSIMKPAQEGLLNIEPVSS